MKAVVTLGNGGYEQLSYRDVAVQPLRPGEVRLKVLAAGVNNTEINTRLGWYASDVTQSTDDHSTFNTSSNQIEGGGWNSATPFPFIQGTDCCGEIVEFAPGCSSELKLGDRVLVRSCMRLNGFSSPENIWMASDFDGAFAQYVNVPYSEVFAVNSNWSDAELATLPCAYGTAENMVHRADVGASTKVLVTGASGGVGSALVQLAKLRGAEVTAVIGASKVAHAQSMNIDHVIVRGTPLVESMGESSFDVVLDNVGGEQFPTLLKLLKRGGRYVSSGAISGPIVNLDLRDMYLKDLRLIGCTGWDEAVFPQLVTYLEKERLTPLLANTYALADIVTAQQAFMEKKHFGKIVLLPAH